MLTDAYLEPNWTSTMELFYTSIKSYFKNVLNSIDLPLGSSFSWKKLQLSKLREKLFIISNIMVKTFFQE